MQSIAWHYATRRKLDAIVAYGELLPTDVGAKPPELPVLWFSLNQVWEPTAQKDWREPGGIVQPPSKKAARLRAGGLVRFGYPAEKCIMWPMLAKKAKIPPRIRIALERAGREEGANPAD
jgi:hypothetical protein